ncbi:hypothetical protein Tco_0748285 [Tanacetum coccineum]|uniref:Uncharacterized protein n=1 Tax=Tanacetum coccineum TaxID=301880 RepID=A0ABQ4YV63_9ASTR
MRSISRIKSSSRHEVTIPNPVFCCSEIWGCDRLVSEPLGYRELGREHSQEINNLNVPALISQAPGSSRKRSRSPSSPFFPDDITFSDGKPASETSGLNPEDVTARLEDLEVGVDTLHANTEDKELLISELQDSLAAAENEIALLQIRVTDAEDKHAEDHEQIQKILARLNL